MVKDLARDLHHPDIRSSNRRRRVRPSHHPQALRSQHATDLLDELPPTTHCPGRSRMPAAGFDAFKVTLSNLDIPQLEYAKSSAGQRTTAG